MGRPSAVAIVVALVMAAVAAPGAALAHVSIDVGDGRYVMEIGFRDEPAYLGQPNALFLTVEEYATGGTKPVDGLAATLSAEVKKDGQTKSLVLAPTGDGQYEAPFVPTATGDYTFHISGTIGDASVDESVTSGPNTFNAVEPLSAVQFPVVWDDPGTLANDVDKAAAAADTARLFGIAGLVVGALGLVVGAIALARSARKPSQAAAVPLEPAGKLVR
jgi:hypothetical protein